MQIGAILEFYDKQKFACQDHGFFDLVLRNSGVPRFYRLRLSRDFMF